MKLTLRCVPSVSVILMSRSVRCFVLYLIAFPKDPNYLETPAQLLLKFERMTQTKISQ